MLKRDITYENFNGDLVTETYYFNLSKSEILSLDASYENGLNDAIQKIIDKKDTKALIHEFQKLILLAYGIKSEDGKRFIKNDTIREEFIQSAAYDLLFIELATNDALAAEFMLGIMPKDMAQAAQKELKGQ